MSVFGRFHRRLQEAIAHRLGWSSLREVQEQAGEALLDGSNAVILAPTAGGKTEASLFPALSMLCDDPPRGVGVVYIAPIKALLNNQAERLGLYTEMVGLRRFVWHGDVKQGDRRAFLREPAEVLLTTPESLEVMFISSRVSPQRLFRDLRMVVIDEIHAMAGTDRGTHLMSIIERLAELTPHDLQRVGLSATVGNPLDILMWLTGSSKRRGVVVDPPTQRARRELLIVQRDELGALAQDAAKLARGRKSLLFCQSRKTTEAVAQGMRAAGTTVFVHHSSVSTEEREAAEARFHGSGTDACIVATSTLELGIDVGDLDRVFQIDAPSTVGSFMQRMGRTGRRPGSVANTTFFTQHADATLQAIALIELAREGWVESVPIQVRCWPVLVHQLLARALADGGLDPEEAWATLQRVPDFAGVDRELFDEIVEHMVREDYLYELGGRLSLGDRGEREFGKRNFLELYAVFSSPTMYSVVTRAGRSLGSLEQAFVDQLEEERTSFVLAGRGWQVVTINHEERRITVDPAGRGKEPSWGGYMPQFLGFELCRKIRDVLAGDRDYPYLHATARAALQARREELGPLLQAERSPLVFDEDGALWWTFGGGRVNATLKHALQVIGDFKVSTDNFSVRIRQPSSGMGSIEGALERLRQPELWDDDALWDWVADGLPAYRLSKFQQALPAWAQREMVMEWVLDRRSSDCVRDG